MKMPNSYTYRFFYKLGFYLTFMCLCLSTLGWITASHERDNAITYQILWRKNYIESRALLGLSLRQTDFIIDQITAQEYEMWDLYCSRRNMFRQNIARKAMEDVKK